MSAPISLPCSCVSSSLYPSIFLSEVSISRAALPANFVFPIHPACLRKMVTNHLDWFCWRFILLRFFFLFLTHASSLLSLACVDILVKRKQGIVRTEQEMKVGIQGHKDAKKDYNINLISVLINLVRKSWILDIVSKLGTKTVNLNDLWHDRASTSQPLTDLRHCRCTTICSCIESNIQSNSIWIQVQAQMWQTLWILCSHKKLLGE